MGRKKRGENPYTRFDCLNEYVDKSFFQTFHSQLQSPAYMDLTDGAKVLLMICKDCRRYSTAGRQGEFYPNAPRNDPTMFFLNRAVLKMYGWTSPNKFRERMKELILHGFVKCVEDGFFTRTKNVYQFSTEWKHLKAGETIQPEGVNASFLKGHEKRIKE